jgi:hypothetical protein
MRWSDSAFGELDVLYFCGDDIITIWVSDLQRTCDGRITCSSQRWGDQGRFGDVEEPVLFPGKNHRQKERGRGSYRPFLMQ